MKFCIATNYDNGKGLQRDAELLRELIEEAGAEVVFAHTERDSTAPKCDLIIFLETVRPEMFPASPRRWVVPNPEWWKYDEHLGAFEYILCKTKDALRIFSEKVGDRAVFTGWSGRDRLLEDVLREPIFLHVAGGSTAKGTDAVVNAWKARKGALPELHVVSSVWKGRAPKGVKVYKHLPDEELQALQNRCLYHLQPSEYEGFGHVVWESLSVGAMLGVTAGPPLSEVTSASPIAVASTRAMNAAVLSIVSPEAVLDTVDEMMAAVANGVRTARFARAEYEAMNSHFLETVVGLFKPLFDADSAAKKAAAARVAAAAEKASIPKPADAPDVAPLDDEIEPVPASEPADGPTPRVAIVLPSHVSGAALVLRSVLALRHQTASKDLFEVVIAADGGDDGSLAAAAAEAARVDLPGSPVRCKVVDSPRPRGPVPHRNHARNAGWQAARAPICVMIDADFILPPHFVEHLLVEHDAAMAAGDPAVFTPCLAGISASPEKWLELSEPWTREPTLEGLSDLFAAAGTSADIYSGFPDRYSPGAPMSAPIGDLPEGMPILWRGVLEGLGGFDEGFGEWGADKEEFVDRLKGCVREGMFKIRLLSSVLAIHQPHERDPAAWSAAGEVRQQERRRRLKLINANTAWWRARAECVKAHLPDALAAARPDAARPVPAPARREAVQIPRDVLAVIMGHLRARSRRDRTSCAVIGRWSDSIAYELNQAETTAYVTTIEELATRIPGTVRQIVIVDALAGLDDKGFRDACEIIVRVCGPNAPAVLIERTRLGSPPGGERLRPPMDFQRAIRGLNVAGQRGTTVGVFTVLAGRLVG